MFWAWLLKYSSFVVTGVVSLVVGYLLHLITTKRSDLFYYFSEPQWVTPPAQEGQPARPIGTFTLFIYNQGKAPAREVHIGHFFLPLHNVYPDLPREVVQTPGGGAAIRFPTFPGRTIVSVSYLLFAPLAVNQVLSYVGSEDGTAKHIPVMLQRVWPKWFLNLITALLFAGLWVAVNAVWSLIHFLWVVYYR